MRSRAMTGLLEMPITYLANGIGGSTIGLLKTPRIKDHGWLIQDYDDIPRRTMIAGILRGLRRYSMSALDLTWLR